jgi:hypothetical protein
MKIQASITVPAVAELPTPFTNINTTVFYVFDIAFSNSAF